MQMMSERQFSANSLRNGVFCDSRSAALLLLLLEGRVSRASGA